MLVKNAELEEKKKSKMGLNKDQKIKEANKKMPKWKMQSEQLRNQLKLGAEADSGKGDQPKYDSKQHDGYTHCDLCSRRYNEDAYKKHLNFCQKKNQKDTFLKGNSNTSTANKEMSNRGGQKPGLNVKFRK
jgi:hypothetical protein